MNLCNSHYYCADKNMIGMFFLVFYNQWEKMWKKINFKIEINRVFSFFSLFKSSVEVECLAYNNKMYQLLFSIRAGQWTDNAKKIYFSKFGTSDFFASSTQWLREENADKRKQCIVWLSRWLKAIIIGFDFLFIRSNIQYDTDTR